MFRALLSIFFLGFLTVRYMQKRLSAKTTLATGTAMAMIVRDVLLFPAETRTLKVRIIKHPK